MTESLTPERWEAMQHLLLAALELPEAERGGFLCRACAEDEGLRLEVESLLTAHASSGPVDRMADALGARMLAEIVDDGGLEGETVGRYEVGERLGRGGMGVVYRAWDPKLERHVALKGLPGLVSSDEARRQRLLAEAQMAAGLEHPHICTIHEIGETDDGRLFIAMPLYDGETLRRKLESGRLAEEEAVRLALHAARGLARAHERGVVHRDIKPGNLMITRDGTLKILDFGIAQSRGATDPGGQTPGTAHYMSPEQVAHGSVDARSDLWSLGVVLYEMLAGRRPFDGKSQKEVVHSVMHAKAVPLSTILPAISPALETLIHELLQKDPYRRPGSAAQVVEALRDAGREVRAPQTRQPGRRSGALAAAAVAILAFVALAAVGRIAGLPLDDPADDPGKGALGAAMTRDHPSSEEQARPRTSGPVSDEAREALRQGIVLQRRYQTEASDASLERGIELLARAVELEPDWAEAHAELARAYHWLASGPMKPRRDEYYRNAKAEARTAIRLDETVPGGHAALAFVLHYEGDWAGAEREYRRALELAPEDNYYRWGWALFEFTAARYEDAVADFRWALEQAPLSPELDAQLAQALVCAGRYEEARTLAERYEDDEPGTLVWLGNISLRQGAERRALAQFERAVERSDSSTLALASLAYAYASVGREQEARALVPELEARDAWIPAVYAALGERRRALDELERGYDQGRAELYRIRCLRAAAFMDLTQLGGLADDPRMEALMGRIAFPS